MNTLEPFGLKNITNPIAKVADKVGDKTKDVGGNVVDKTKDVSNKVADVSKNVGNKVVDVGKNVGGKIVDVGKGIGKILGPAFKQLLNFFMMLMKNWKLALGLVIFLVVAYFTFPIWSVVFRVFSGLFSGIGSLFGGK
jgi:hypothetical protein